MLKSVTTPVSLEFFPPKNELVRERLRLVRQKLYALEPEFCSVTYGAGGSTQAGTFASVAEILNEGVAVASHLSCIGASAERMARELENLQALGVKRLVVLRGDLPNGKPGDGPFCYASDLVAFIRAQSADYFQIEVACYPEVHPQAPSPKADLLAFATKVKAGANRAITQYFYNIDSYFRFVDEVRAAGLDIPIIPGIMPITNSVQLLRFSANCGAEIPRWMRLRMQAYADDLQSLRAFGLDVVTDLCERLLAAGVPGLHFYTMNQADPVLHLCERLNLIPQTADMA